MFRKLGRTTFPRACDTCHSGVYCPIHSAFLCRSCYVTLHAASLCSSCDHKIHVGGQNQCGVDFDDDDDDGGDDAAEAASWLVLNPEKDDDGEGLEFKGDGNSCGELTQNGFCDVSFGDDVEMQHQQQVPFELGFEFDSSKSLYGSRSHNVSISSTDVNSVLESTISEVSVCDSNPAISTRIDLSSGTHILMPSSHLTYREARVQRYREKKKTRKFEKKIRYASRKAYAEIRPRIKGRFAKRNNVEAEMDHVLSSALIPEAEYSVLQSF